MSDTRQPRKRTTNSRYVVTFSADDYAVLREWLHGTKIVTTAEVKAILRRRKHYNE